MPRVSVIVPAYNAAEHIEEALRSVVAQSYGDWEAVVADDASTDDTGRRAQVIDERVRVVRAASNAGPAAARNLAISHASGELLAFLDADDAWLPSYLEEMVGLYDRALALGRRVGVVACDAQIIGPDGSPNGLRSELAGVPRDVDVTTLLRANPIHVSALVPRELVDALGGFSSDTWGSEDHDLWLRIVERRYEVVSTRRALAIYRVREDSTSARAAGMARSSQATYRRALARGYLTAAQRRLARRQLRLHEAVEAVESLAERRGKGLGLSPPHLVAAARAAATFAWFALRHPLRWPGWARALATGNRAPWRTKRVLARR
jgi:glycosyltransferase involved in cell wall biosynthesis